MAERGNGGRSGTRGNGSARAATPKRKRTMTSDASTRERMSARDTSKARTRTTSAAQPSRVREAAPQARGDLSRYNAKRDFARTPEPRGTKARSARTALGFFVQRHHARSLHYDFRLEWDGALKSWAVPKGPSLDPDVLRLAVQVEDHPLSYGSFEGSIPAGEYGAGKVVLWDRGHWIPRDDPAEGLRQGKLHFELRGEKLIGNWVLFRSGRDERHWMLRKLDDAQARAGDADAILERRPESVLGATPRRSAGKSPGPAAARKSTAASAPAASQPARASRKTSAPASATDAATVAGIKVTSPDRVVYAKPRTTKLDVVRYYEAVAEHLFPEVARRPVSLMRCPQGVQGTRGAAIAQCFYQKHLEHLPKGMRAVRSNNPDIADYVAIDKPQALVALAQHGTIEFHCWGARLPKLGQPDRMVFDLDPGPGLAWPVLIEAALLTRALLQEFELPTLLKTTGGKGLHVIVPLKPARTWDEVKSFARALARRLAQAAPERFTATLTKSRRSGKVFIDYLRNGEGATYVAAYSLRAREGAPVAMPIDWDELTPKRDLRGAYFNIANAVVRAPESARLWRTADASAVTLTRQMLRRAGVGE